MVIFCMTGNAVANSSQPSSAPSLLKIVKPVHFRLPLACTIGTDCWVLNYPDVGPDGDGTATDPACAARSYEGHKGTDIAIADAAIMARGVDVLAARDGTVLRARDSEDDHFPVTKEQLDAIKAEKKECGNAVLIDHGEGWQSMYCHMKRGSIAVKPDQKVKAGDKIGQVGASGMTEFPHIHIGITHDGKVMDPFTNKDITEKCGGKPALLFDKASGISYQHLTFMKLGFDSGPTAMDKIDQGHISLEQLPRDAAALVFYAVMLGVRQGDIIDIRIEDPKGGVFSEKTITQEKTRARQMLFVGRKVPQSAPLMEGNYTGKIKVTRPNKDGTSQIFNAERGLTVTSQ